jgi:two-component system response regulator ResD
MERILVVEDEVNIAQLVRLYLTEAGYEVLEAGDGVTALELHARERPDLIVLDLMLPGLDGMEVCRRIRSWASTPILMLTARGMEAERIAGLDLGADDYITKPFSPREMVSRVRAILRRTTGATANGGPASPNGELLRFPGLVINIAARRVEVDGRPVDLTAKEFDLLAALAGSPDRVFSREALLSKVWDYAYAGDTRTVDVHIGTLRKKMEPEPAHPRFIKTVWGVGYRFDPRGAPD